MQSNFEKVGLFHLVMGHPVYHNGDEPKKNLLTENPKLISFRIALIEEEILEFSDAVAQSNFVEMADALCDTLYVIYGAFHCLGLNPDNLIKPVSTYKSNVTRIELFNNQTTPYANMMATSMGIYKMILMGCVNEIKLARDTENYDLFVDSLCRLISTVYWVGNQLDFDLNTIFEEVQQSNMSKVCLTEEEAQQSVEWYKQNETRYKNPSYRKSDDPKYWVVFDAETSKILKSINFKLPNIKQFI